MALGLLDGLGRLPQLGDLLHRLAKLLERSPAVHTGRLRGRDGLGQLRLVPDCRREDLGLEHGDHGPGLDGDDGDVLLVEDVHPGAELAVAQDAVLVEQSNRFLRLQDGQGVYRGPEVGQAALGGLLVPAWVVVVAVVDHPAVLLHDVLENGLDRLLEALGRRVGARPVFEHGGEVVDGLGDDRVQDGVGPGDRRAGADGPKLELVAGEGEGAGAVAVAAVSRDLGQRVGAQIELPALLGGPGVAAIELIEDVVEHLPEVDGDDGRRRLVGSEAVVVAGAGDGGAKQVGVHVDGPNHRHEEHEELHVGVGFLTRVEEVHPGVGRDRPVVVLARAVDAGEGLLVEQAHEPVMRGAPPQHVHHEHLVVGGDVGVLEDRGDLVLARGDLVVPGLDRDAQLVQPALDLVHEAHDPLLDRPEVVIVELVALRRGRPDERAAAHLQVQTLVEEVAIDQEVLLLGAEGGDDLRDPFVGAEDPQDPHRLLADGLDRAEQGGLLVEGLARPRDEGGGDAQGGVAVGLEHEGRAGGVPGGVAAGLVRVADAPRGERAGVRLAPDELIAGELCDCAPFAVWAQERVVLLGGRSGERLEPVTIVRGAVLERPLLHGEGHGVGDRRIQRQPPAHRPLELLEDVRRQPLEHHVAAEGERAELLSHRAVVVPLCHGGRPVGTEMTIVEPGLVHVVFLAECRDALAAVSGEYPRVRGQSKARRAQIKILCKIASTTGNTPRCWGQPVAGVA